jgi:hypothetical protein
MGPQGLLGQLNLGLLLAPKSLWYLYIRTCKNALYNEFIDFLRMRRGVETQGNLPKNSYIEMCTIFKKKKEISKYVEGNHGGTYI